MSYRLVRTSRFDRRLSRFLRRHRDLAARLAEVLVDVEADRRRPQLRLHALRGDLNGFSAVWIGYEWRLVIEVDEASGTILLVDIGSHDEVYG